MNMSILCLPGCPGACCGDRAAWLECFVHANFHLWGAGVSASPSPASVQLLLHSQGLSVRCRGLPLPAGRLMGVRISALRVPCSCLGHVKKRQSAGWRPGPGRRASPVNSSCTQAGRRGPKCSSAAHKLARAPVQAHATSVHSCQSELEAGWTCFSSALWPDAGGDPGPLLSRSIVTCKFCMPKAVCRASGSLRSRTRGIEAAHCVRQAALELTAATLRHSVWTLGVLLQGTDSFGASGHGVRVYCLGGGHQQELQSAAFETRPWHLHQS